MLKRFAEETAIEALTGKTTVLRQDHLDWRLSHDGCSGHLEESFPLCFQRSLLVLVELEHLVDEQLVALLSGKLVRVHALGRVSSQLATLFRLLIDLSFLLFDALKKFLSLLLTGKRVHKIIGVSLLVGLHGRR